MICNITGVFYLPDGTVASNRTLSFKPIKNAIVPIPSGGMIPDVAIVETDENGNVDFNLLTGSYIVAVIVDKCVVYKGSAVVPDLPDADINDILQASMSQDSFPEWLTEALQARDEAVEARDEAIAAVDGIDQTVAAAVAVAVPPAVDAVVSPYLDLYDDSTGVPIQRLVPDIDLSGDTYQRENLQKAINIAGDKTILLPNNSKILVDATESLRPASDCGISIKGSENSVIEHFEESDTVWTNGWRSLFNLTNTTGKNLSFDSVTLKGQFFENRTEGRLRLLDGSNLGSLYLNNVNLRESRAALGVVKGTEFFRATGLKMEYSQRDGIMLIVPSGPVVIDDFDARWLRDDVFHVDFNDETMNTTLTYPPGGQDITITNGRLLATLGILVSGGRRVTIRDIHASFVSNRLIRVGTIVSGTYAGVGTTSIMDVNIDGIIAEDMIFNPDRPGPPLRVFDISMPVAAAGDGEGIPTLPNDEGHIVRPEGLYTSTRQGVDPDVPVPPAAGIMIDNVIVRRVAKQGPFTDVGLGPFIGQQGDIDDLVLDDENTRPDVFFLSGSGDVRIGPNIDATGINNLVRYDPRDVPDRTFSVNATGGKVTDMSGSMFYVQPNRGEPMNHRIRFSGIEVDGDPWCINGSRSAAGAWGNRQTPSLFRASEMQDVEAVGLRVRNVQRIAHPIGWEAGVRGRDNILHCDPVAVGNTAGNAGIRVVPAPSRVWQHVIEGSNPENYNEWAKVLNPCVLESESMPSSGKWVEGQIVKNIGQDSRISHWMRLTTGEGNIVDTDWEVVYYGAPVGISFYINNSDLTYIWGEYKPTLVYAPTITSDRTITMSSAGNVIQGDIVKLIGAYNTASGSWTVNIQEESGQSITSLNIGEFVDIMFVGDSWYQISSGSLS